MRGLRMEKVLEKKESCGIIKPHNGQGDKTMRAIDLKDRYSVLWLYASLCLTDSEIEKILSE